jgi:hypothetical protein
VPTYFQPAPAAISPKKQKAITFQRSPWLKLKKLKASS